MRWLAPMALVLITVGAGSSRAAEDPARCALIRGRAKYGALGYDHLVEVDNRCSQEVVCEVWTDVDPEPHHTLRVAAGKKDAVRTRVGSPAREFHAEGHCEFQ